MRLVRRLRLSLASQILIFQLAIVLGALVLGAAASYLNESRQLDQRYEQRSLNIAQSVAGMPSVGDGLRDSDPSRTLQPLAEGIRKASGASFVVIAGANGIRYSHPNLSMIGKPIDEDYRTVLAGRITLINDEACRLLRLSSGSVGQRLTDLLPPGRVRDLLIGEVTGADEMVLAADRVLVVSRMPVVVRDRTIGHVATFRDRTELEGLLRELDNARSVSEALRAQAHDFSNRLHTIAGLIELGRDEEAIQLTTESSSVSQELTEALLERVGDPVLGALLLGKSAVAAERGIQFRLSPDSRLDGDAGHPRDLITVVGNLIDNALDAAATSPNGGPRWVEVAIRQEGGDVVIQVHDSGPGIGLGETERIFSEGYTTKLAGPGSRRGLGLALVKQVAARRGGAVTVVNHGGAVFTVRLPLTATPVSVGAS